MRLKKFKKELEKCNPEKALEIYENERKNLLGNVGSTYLITSCLLACAFFGKISQSVESSFNSAHRDDISTIVSSVASSYNPITESTNETPVNYHPLNNLLIGSTIGFGSLVSFGAYYLSRLKKLESVYNERIETINQNRAIDLSKRLEE